MTQIFDHKKATGVLLADGWHDIVDGTLEGVCYEFGNAWSSVTHAGVRWREEDEGGEKISMFAPLGQVLAISGGWPEEVTAVTQEQPEAELVGA